MEIKACLDEPIDDVEMEAAEEAKPETEEKLEILPVKEDSETF